MNRSAKRCKRETSSVMLLLCIYKSVMGFSPAFRSPLFSQSEGRYTSLSYSSKVYGGTLSRWNKLYLSSKGGSNFHENDAYVGDADETSDSGSPMKVMHNSIPSQPKDYNSKDHNSLPLERSEAFNVQLLTQENELLRETVRQLEIENQRLSGSSSKIIIETFEGEGGRTFGPAWYANTRDGGGVEMDSSAQWCDELDEGQCPIEPTISFMDAMRDRAYWLVGLLVLQSCSGFILSHNEALLERHQVIIYFLTMLVGAGGNAGNQASVRVIRGLALGTLNEKTQSQFLWRELKMAAILSAILSTAGFLRAVAFATPLPETIAVTSALALIVFSSICLGAVLPLFLKKLGVDPAHSSTTIQVVMDILGVLLTVVVSTAVLDSPVGQMLIAKLIG